MAVIATVEPSSSSGGGEQVAKIDEPSRTYQIEGNTGLLPFIQTHIPCWFQTLGAAHSFMERIRCKGVDSLKVGSS